MYQALKITYLLKKTNLKGQWREILARFFKLVYFLWDPHFEAKIKKILTLLFL